MACSRLCDPATAAAYATCAVYRARGGEDDSRFDDAECRAQCDLLRDLMPHPTRPVEIAPGLRTAAVVALARAAYDHRLLPAGHLDRDLLGVLSDALEEAGCTDAELLGHLRSPGPHFRGCRALDSLLALG